RLDQLAFAQRVFSGTSGEPTALANALIAVRAFPRQRMLMLTLERIGVTAPALYAAMSRQAARIGQLEGRKGFIAQAQFQGAVSFVAAMARARTIDHRKSEAVLEPLAGLRISEDGRYDGAVASWLRDALGAVGSPVETDYEGALLAAL